jgi:hypothetical protein
MLGHMKPRTVKVLFLLWLGWYLSGPIAETIDSWDPPQEEIRDVMRNAGGLATLFAAVVYMGMTLLRKLRQRCALIAKVVCARLSAPNLDGLVLLSRSVATPAHSPPSPLRI